MRNIVGIADKIIKVIGCLLFKITKSPITLI